MRAVINAMMLYDKFALSVTSFLIPSVINPLITEKEEKYLIFLTKEPQPEQIARAASAYKGRELFYSPGSKPCFSLATALGLKGLKEFLNNLQKSFDTDKK